MAAVRHGRPLVRHAGASPAVVNTGTTRWSGHKDPATVARPNNAWRVMRSPHAFDLECTPCGGLSCAVS